MSEIRPLEPAASVFGLHTKKTVPDNDVTKLQREAGPSDHAGLIVLRVNLKNGLKTRVKDWLRDGEMVLGGQAALGSRRIYSDRYYNPGEMFGVI
ncbi:MAG: hypothetical protein M1840_005362 [Geoglossum simile]|nr:MAG: hypothetical protein M1840_005362 [Geoglossum simile]